MSEQNERDELIFELRAGGGDRPGQLLYTARTAEAAQALARLVRMQTGATVSVWERETNPEALIYRGTYGWSDGKPSERENRGQSGLR